MTTRRYGSLAEIEAVTIQARRTLKAGQTIVEIKAAWLRANNTWELACIRLVCPSTIVGDHRAIERVLTEQLSAQAGELVAIHIFEVTKLDEGAASPLPPTASAG